MDGGFELGVGQKRTFDASDGWSGRFWGRTGCNFTGSTSPSSVACETGDCGGKLECSGLGAAPPATLAEFTLASSQSDNKDFYDVSLVDGYNIPIAISPTGNPSTKKYSTQHDASQAESAVDYDCGTAGCIADLNLNCPKELQLLSDTDQSSVIGCKSACEAFQSSEYCCTGSYANPNTCQASSYSKIFKKACPRAYSYAYDDNTSTFTCTGSEFSIIFCPTSLSEENGGGRLTDLTSMRMIIHWWKSCCIFSLVYVIVSIFST
ncbi:hypothetical protein KP509_31G046600 [Ceratopteris richardii]|nr:hypothetical protein KP509_31G046600 [Ceratopteris richardii]